MRCLLRTPLRAFSLVPLLASQRSTSGLAFSSSLRTRPSSTRLSARKERRSIFSTTSPSLAEVKLLSQEDLARQKRVGQASRRLTRAVRREDRISVLEQQSALQPLSEAERKELQGLRESNANFEEQYNEASFSEEHVEFKRLHNEALIALCRYCQQERNNNDELNVFYLDGPEGGTTSALTDIGGLDPSQCFVANRHLSSCQALRNSGGGRLPDENVLHMTAAEALSPDASEESSNTDNFSDLNFAAYYLDGCGGFVPHVVGMMSAALLRTTMAAQTTAVGFSLMGGNKDVVDKELAVCQALTIIARTRGMRTRHVLDDPTRYGIPSDIRKTSQQTFTTWILLEPDPE